MVFVAAQGLIVVVVIICFFCKMEIPSSIAWFIIFCYALGSLLVGISDL